MKMQRALEKAAEYKESACAYRKGKKGEPDGPLICVCDGFYHVYEDGVVVGCFSPSVEDLLATNWVCEY